MGCAEQWLNSENTESNGIQIALKLAQTKIDTWLWQKGRKKMPEEFFASLDVSQSISLELFFFL